MKKKLFTWILLLTILMTSFSGCIVIKNDKSDDGAEKTKKEKVQQEEEEEGSSETGKKKDKKAEKEEKIQRENPGAQGKLDKKDKKEEKKEEKADKQDKKDKKDKKENPEEKLGTDGGDWDFGPQLKKRAEAMEAYRDILSSVYDLIASGATTDEIQPGEAYIWETIRNYGQAELFGLFGYLVMDISGDGVPELIIANRQSSMEYPANYVYLMYTLVNGKPERVLESAAEYDFYVTVDGIVFFHTGYESMRPAFSLFQLSKDGLELNCKECYFVMEKDVNFNSVGYYYNNHGVMEPSVSQELNIDEKGLEEQRNRLFRELSLLPLSPFSDYEIAEGRDYAVTVEEINLENSAFLNYDVYEVDKSNPETDLRLSPTRPVKNFKLLELKHYFDKDKELRFKTKTLHSLPKMNIDYSLLVRMTFTGDYPTLGFSYEEDGRTSRYAIAWDKKTRALSLIRF